MEWRGWWFGKSWSVKRQRVHSKCLKNPIWQWLCGGQRLILSPWWTLQNRWESGWKREEPSGNGGSDWEKGEARARINKPEDRASQEQTCDTQKCAHILLMVKYWQPFLVFCSVTAGIGSRIPTATHWWSIHCNQLTAISYWLVPNEIPPPKLTFPFIHKHA